METEISTIKNKNSSKEKLKHESKLNKINEDLEKKKEKIQSLKL